MLEEQLNQLYEGYGYRKFRMSKFEDYDLYAQNKDFLKKGHIITFTDVDGSLKALKPDITLSIMKNNNGDSEKVYYNENVYREMGGIFKEILQVGVESVGQIDPYAEAEVIALAAKSLKLLSEDYVLDLSDVSFVRCLLGGMGKGPEVEYQPLPSVGVRPHCSPYRGHRRDPAGSGGGERIPVRASCAGRTWLLPPDISVWGQAV